jgi:hypothetical protein
MDSATQRKSYIPATSNFVRSKQLTNSSPISCDLARHYLGSAFPHHKPNDTALRPGLRRLSSISNSSPQLTYSIACLADALSMVVVLPTTSVYLRISPKKATRLLLIAQFAEDNKTEGLGEPQKREVQDLRHATWAGWLFFVLGALPAAIKLGPFTGVPWAQAWGMMSVSSFAVIKPIPLLSISSIRPQDHFSVPEALGYTPFEWQGPQHNILRHKVKLLRENVMLFQTLLFCIEFVAHTVLLLWASETLLLDCFSVLADSASAMDIRTMFELSVLTAIFSTGLFYLTTHVFRFGTFLRRGLQFKSIASALCKAYLPSGVFPKYHVPSLATPKKIQVRLGALATPIVIVYAYYSLYTWCHMLAGNFLASREHCLLIVPPHRLDLVLQQNRKYQRSRISVMRSTKLHGWYLASFPPISASVCFGMLSCMI